MDTWKTVLIPLDDSEFSRSILESVEDLFPTNRFKIVLLHVAAPVPSQIAMPPRPIAIGWPMSVYASAHDVELAHHPIYSTQQEQSARASYMHRLNAIAKELTACGYTVACDVWFGAPAESITTFATTRHVDVIAMATHARSGVSHLLLGSVAEDVLRQATMPVLLVHPREDVFAQRMLVNEESATTLQHKAM